ncbi:MAG: hypothetical protein R3C05_03870 [Pirellulaceae bacterium]
MANITSRKLLWFKGGLFVLLGMIAAGLLIARTPSLTSAILLAICVWAFCRAYYFAFYVIEHYVDRDFRFAGLWDFAKYALLGRSPDRRSEN